MNLGFLIGGGVTSGTTMADVIAYLTANNYTKAQIDTLIANSQTASKPANQVEDIAHGGTGATTAAAAFAALKQAATTGATGVVQLATSLEAITGTDATKVVTPQAMAAAVFNYNGALVNTRAPRGAAVFDGTAATGISRDGGSAIAFGASDPACYSVFADIPSTAPANTQGLFGQSDTARVNIRAGATDGFIDTNLTFKGRLYGATTSDYRELSVDLTPWAGTNAWLHWDVRAGVLSINGTATTGGVATNGTAPAWSAAITGTIYNIGVRGSSSTYIGRLSGFILWNHQPSTADLLETYRNGGVPPERLKFGSQLELLSTNDSAFSGGSTGWSSGRGGTATLNTGTQKLDVTSTGTHAGTRNSGYGLFNKVYRFKGTLSNVTGTTIEIGSGNQGSSAFNYVASGLSNGAFNVVLNNTQGNQIFVGTEAASGSFTLDDLSLKQVGAVVRLPLDDGIGYQFHDLSTNKLDAVATNTGVAHLLPRERGYVRGTLTWAGTHEGKSLLGQQALEPDCVVEALSLKPTAATSGGGTTFGNTANATRYLGTTTLSTAKTYKRGGAEISNGGVPSGTSANDLDLVIDPDTANYTGSIDVWVGITRTLGLAA